MIVFRRVKISNTWHWCRNCSGWPRWNFEERNSEQTLTGELCKECLSKERAETVKKDEVA